jgi:6-pyruvoyltetrahydropterin/6-carboxytetrahydropterin synthase
MQTISKTFRFEAAHRLQNHPSKCRRLHGHSYIAEVRVSGYVNQYTGMVTDFENLNSIKTWIDLFFDHKTILQDSDPLVPILSDEIPDSLHLIKYPPTAENLAKILMFEAQKQLKPFNLSSVEIKLWETSTSYAIASSFSQPLSSIA